MLAACRALPGLAPSMESPPVSAPVSAPVNVNVNVNVLVVEDDAAVRRGVVDALRAAGYTPHECARGDAAVDAASGCAAGLVLLDVTLPGCDGFTALTALRAGRPAKSAEEKRKTSAERQRRFREARRGELVALRKVARKRAK